MDKHCGWTTLHVTEMLVTEKCRCDNILCGKLCEDFRKRCNGFRQVRGANTWRGYAFAAAYVSSKSPTPHAFIVNDGQPE